MGDFFKKLDEIMTGDFVRKVGGVVCLVAIIVIGLGFLVGAKSVLNTMKGPEVAAEATDEEATSGDAEEEDDDYADEDEEDYDE